MGVVNDHVEAGPPDGLDVYRLEEVPHVRVGYVLVDDDVADVVQVNATEVFAEEGILDAPLGGLIQIHTLGVEELDLDDAVVEGRDAHVDAASRAGMPGDVAGHRDRHGLDIEHVGARGRQAGDHRPLDHAGAAMRIPVDRNRRTLW